MEQNQSFSIESMLKYCDVKGWGRGGGICYHNDVIFSTRTLDKAPKGKTPGYSQRSKDVYHGYSGGTGAAYRLPSLLHTTR